MVANRCMAADAECLRSIRQSGRYKRLGLNWERFCSERAGISRGYADRIIRHLEKLGANYVRLAELRRVHSHLPGQPREDRRRRRRGAPACEGNTGDRDGRPKGYYIAQAARGFP
jgi:hypothetical protein